MTTQWEYEFDPYGDNPNNKIVDEAHTITPANGKDFTFFIPRKGPFHRRSVVLKDAVTGNPLNLGTDYYFGWRYDDIITSGSVQPVYGAIVMNDPTKTYQVLATYQTLGGSTLLDDAEIVTLLANTGRDPRRALWTDVVDIPEALPPIPHRESTGVVIGFDSVVEVLYKIADSINSGNVKSMQALMEHVADHHNPHRITLEDLGIDELGNLIPATKEEAEAGTNNTHYMTALRTDQYAKAVILPILNTHVSDQNNPHNVTKSQVGLGSVQNYPVASTTEAEAGVATNRYMTPATSVMLMNAQFKPLVDAHIADKANPHGTTKSQVGLGNVDNYQTATAAEASEGKATNRFMTPYLVGVAIAGQVNAAIDYHTGDFDNPHKTTKAQVGLGNVDNYATASIQEATAGTAIDKFMTPYLTANAIIVQAPIVMEFHTNDNNNPHGVTKTQVGLGNVSNYATASLDEAKAGTATDRFLTPAGAAALITLKLKDYPGPTVTKESIGLGLVENYAPATDEDMVSLEGSKYVTVSALKSFLSGEGGTNFITKTLVGLDKVNNYGIATNEDIENRVKTAYATPNTVELMLEDSLETNLLLTSSNPGSLTGGTYPIILPDSSLGVVATGDGMVVSYSPAQADSYTSVYSITSYALTAANQVVNYKLTNATDKLGMFIPFANFFAKSLDFGFNLAVKFEADGAWLGMVGTDNSYGIGDKVSIPAIRVGDTITMKVTLTPSTNAYAISFVAGGQTFSMNGTLKTVLDLIGLEDAPSNFVMSGAFGLSAEVDNTLASNDVTLTSDYIPVSSKRRLVYVADKSVYAYSNAGWTKVNESYSLVPGRQYWNPISDELFVAVTTKRAIAFGMGSIVN